MTYEAIEVTKKGPSVVVTLNRPEKLNAISATLREEVHRALGAALEDDTVRAAILIGAGRGFCSGVDLTGSRPPPAGAGGATQAQMLDETHWVGRWAMLFHNFDKPLIAAVNGVAAGAGMSMALGADMRIGSEHARFKTVFVERSLSPDSGMSYLLPRIIGYARAADLIMTSRMVDAEEAYRLGLLDRLVKHDALLDAALELAEEIAQWPPLAMRMAKRVLKTNFDANIEEALRYEALGLDFARKARNDLVESGLAFREKRKGVFTGT